MENVKDLGRGLGLLRQLGGTVHYKLYRIYYLYHWQNPTGVQHPWAPDSQSGRLFTGMDYGTSRSELGYTFVSVLPPQ